jgi:TolC family type I secretion outer membrane protein
VQRFPTTPLPFIQSKQTSDMKSLRPLLFLLATAPAVLLAAPLAEEPAVPDELDLPTAIKYALEHNYSILVAREKVRQAQGTLLTARSGYLPKAILQAGYSRTDPDYIPGRDNDTWNASATLQQTLYDAGSTPAASKAARASRDAAESQLHATTSSVLLGVRTGFYKVLQSKDTIKVREQSLALLEEELKNARNRYQAGAGAQFDVLRAEVALANGRPPLITARNDLKIAIEQLRQLLGYHGDRTTDLDKAPAFLGALTFGNDQFDLPTCLSDARRQRPELEALKFSLEAAQAGISSARTGYRPTVTASAGWDWMNDPAGRNWRATRDGWALGIQSQWAIFDGFATKGRLRSALSQSEQARLALREQELAIAVEVRQAYASWQEAVELVNASTKVVEQATEALRLSRARFDVGAATQLDVLQAQVALTDAGNNKVQALYTYNVAVAQLHKAIGRRDPDAP